MIADQIIEDFSKDARIRPATEELIAIVVEGGLVGITSATCEQTFTCNVGGRTYNIKISLEVAGQRKDGA